MLKLDGQRLCLVIACCCLLGCEQDGGDDAPESAAPDAQVMAQMRGAGGVGDAHPGAALYQAHCAQCHDRSVSRAPHRSFLEMLSPNALAAALNTGVMQQQARALSAEQREQIVEFLVGDKPATQPPKLVNCTGEAAVFDFDDAPFATGWGIDPRNSRYIPGAVAGMHAADVSKLRLKWAFAYPQATRARSQPSFAGGALYVGSQSGAVYALDRRSGCVRWVYQSGAEVRTGITVSPWQRGETPRPVGYFSDLLAWVYAVDLTDGALIWRVKADEHPNATTTAQPVLFEDRIYQTVSSLEVVPAADPAYACCTFRGAVVALDAASGELFWKSHTIVEEPREVGKNSAGTPILAPSGAPSWNSPTIDAERRRLYIGTGENYSSPAQGSSDAVIAFDLDNGAIQWIRQTTQGDAWNVACMPFIANQANCPEENGPDVDFGAPPILVDHDGRQILVAGQKSGEVFGIHPASGELLWRQQVGRGGNQGGMHFGMAAAGGIVYVPISDYDDDMLATADARPGIYALDAFSGERLWSRPADDICAGNAYCDPGISAPATAIPGAVLAGHMDGRLRAYAADDGAVLWEFDTTQPVDSLSGSPARGGSMGGASGPMVYDGMLYANSGYGIYFHMPGNVLLAFELGE